MAGFVGDLSPPRVTLVYFFDTFGGLRRPDHSENGGFPVEAAKAELEGSLVTSLLLAGYTQ
jgi:hypothetical protein